jgi:hypothetical protein
MLILKFFSCIFDKKYHFLDFQVFFMYFGFFQNFDKVSGIACSFIAQIIFFRTQNQKFWKSFFCFYFL